MGILGILYSIIISPLVLLFDVIFTLVLNKILYVGWSIVILSLIVNTLVLPLYNRADKIQAIEGEKKLKLKKWEDHIKKHFKGDERFMMLQTYYRQNDYKPYQTLRGALPLLLQIPFFIAAYSYLSNLHMIAGYSFGPIKDLSVPDQIFSISGHGINAMPIIMTIINIVSSTIYNRSNTIKDKIQLYLIALIFLVLLYNSPSGLVLYWTCNNIYSLVKNIVSKFIDKKRNKQETNQVEKEKDTMLVFVGSSLMMAFLVGSYIPLDLISGSTDEFISLNTMTNPSLFVLNSICIAIGLFFVWVGVYYYFSGIKGKRIIAILMMSILVISIINYVVIPFDSSMTAFLTVESFVDPTKTQILQSIIIIISVLLLCIFIVKYKGKNVGYILMFVFIPFFILNIYNFVNVNKKTIRKISQIEADTNVPEIRLSKNGKNVVVIMMDRMVGYYIPYIMYEKPELLDSWDGFTYYPNSISYGTATNVGSPALYGGYDYRPEKINERKNELLKDKQNEALSVMPVLFGEHGYDVTVGNPTYANYEWIPDLSIYDKYPYIYKYNTGAKLNPKDEYYAYDDVLNRNLICYGIYRVTPVFLQSKVYNYGYYNSSSTSFTNGIGLFVVNTLSRGQGINEVFYNAYNVLINLDSISVIKNDESYNFNMLSNDTTHENCMLQEPDYVLSPFVDNSNISKTNSIKRTEDGKEIDLKNGQSDDVKNVDSMPLNRIMVYHGNMVSMMRLGEWFDYLRDEGVYDNTRIIIVSDHSTSLVALDSSLVYKLSYEDGEDEYFDMLAAQCTLLVKDFDSKGFTTNDSFMTNADVPSIATKDLIDNPTNPFTGNTISSAPKNEEQNNIIVSSSWDTGENNGCVFMRSQWFSVKDNIFDPNNWKYEGAH